MQVKTGFLVFICLLSVQCYFKDMQHKEHFAKILDQFMNNFQQRFDVIAFGDLDWHSKMELALNYWITSIRVRGLRQSQFTYETEWDGLVFKSPEIFIDLVIEEQYTVPIKVTNFEFTALLFSDENNLRCTGVQIDYDNISLDLGTVVEYLTKHVLSLDTIKDAIKQSEIPIRNLLHQAIRNNWERIKPLITMLRNSTVDTNSWIDSILEVPNIEKREDAFWLSTGKLFNIKSLRNKGEEEAKVDL